VWKNDTKHKDSEYDILSKSVIDNFKIIVIAIEKQKNNKKKKKKKNLEKLGYGCGNF